MDLCETSYALGNISSARLCLASARRALMRNDGGGAAGQTRARAAVEKALCAVETALHELGSDIAAERLHHLRSG